MKKKKKRKYLPTFYCTLQSFAIVLLTLWMAVPALSREKLYSLPNKKIVLKQMKNKKKKLYHIYRLLKKHILPYLPYLELQPSPHTPQWAKIKEKPRFAFVQIADLHLWRYRTRRLEIARDYIRKNFQLDFFVFTGDNVSGPDKIAHQTFLKKFLDQQLGFPYFIIRGDNDAIAFEQSFGTSHWSFTYKGIHFIGTALDVDIDSVGIGFYRHYQWLEKTIRKQTIPTVIFLHQPIYPPTFLDAILLRKLLEKYPQVRLVVCGHIHYDFEFRRSHILHILAPSLEKHPAHPFKLYLVYSDRIIIKTYHFENGRYRFSHKWQKVLFPKSLQLPPSVSSQFSPLSTPSNSKIQHVANLPQLLKQFWNYQQQYRLKKIFSTKKNSQYPK